MNSLKNPNGVNHLKKSHGVNHSKNPQGEILVTKLPKPRLTVLAAAIIKRYDGRPWALGPKNQTGTRYLKKEADASIFNCCI